MTFERVSLRRFVLGTDFEMDWLYGMIALVTPAVWGYTCYRVLEWLWPAREDEDASARPPRRTTVPPEDFLDFQI